MLQRNYLACISLLQTFPFEANARYAANLRRVAAFNRLASGRDDHAGGAVEPAFDEFDRQETVALDRAGQGERAGLCRREAEAGVVGRIADEHDRAVTEAVGLRQRVAHQESSRRPGSWLPDRRRAGRASAPRSGGRRIDTGLNVPETDGADDPALIVAGDEGEAFGRKPARAQLLRGLLFPVGRHRARQHGIARARHRQRIRAEP
jgi:hypothetical protein